MCWLLLMTIGVPGMGYCGWIRAINALSTPGGLAGGIISMISAVMFTSVTDFTKPKVRNFRLRLSLPLWCCVRCTRYTVPLEPPLPRLTGAELNQYRSLGQWNRPECGTVCGNRSCQTHCPGSFFHFFMKFRLKSIFRIPSSEHRIFKLPKHERKNTLQTHVNTQVMV